MEEIKKRAYVPHLKNRIEEYEVKVNNLFGIINRIESKCDSLVKKNKEDLARLLDMAEGLKEINKEQIDKRFLSVEKSIAQISEKYRCVEERTDEALDRVKIVISRIEKMIGRSDDTRYNPLPVIINYALAFLFMVVLMQGYILFIR